MSNTESGEILSEIELVSVLPDFAENAQSDQLYVSLADLIMEKVYFHPCIEDADLSETDKSTLDAMTGGVPASEYFVSVLVNEIKAGIKEEHKVIRVALSQADSYAFKSLLGGQQCEQDEINPLMGQRGVSRYASKTYAREFALECQVIKELRSQGYDIEVVVPFVRALSDAATIIDRLAEQGLPRGLNGLKLLYSCDVPSSVLLADKLLHYFDGVVVNVDNLAQFTLGVDKLNEALIHSYDLQNDAVIDLIVMLIKTARKVKKPYLVVCPSLGEYPLLQEALAELKSVKVAVTM